jgi:nitric oxide reductase NorD protein
MSIPIRVSLEEGRASLSLFGKGLSEKHLQAKPLGEAPAFLANPWRPFPFSNGKEIYLPASIGILGSRKDHWKLLRLYAAVQAEQWEAGTFDRPRANEAETLWGRQTWMDEKEPLGWIRFFLSRFPLPVLAGNIFFTLETARTAASMKRRFRGLAQDLKWFLPKLKAHSGSKGYLGLLWRLFFGLLAPDKTSAHRGIFGEVMQTAHRVILPGSRLRDSLEACLTVYHLLAPLAKTSDSADEITLLEGVNDFFLEPIPGLRENRPRRFDRTGKIQGQGSFPAELPDALKTLSFVPLPIAAGAGNFLTQEMVKEKSGEGSETAATEPENAASGGSTKQTDNSAERGLHYPEWDFFTGGYRRDWVTLYQLTAEERETGASERLFQGWDDLVREVCRQFRMLRYQERAWRKRLEWGEEIDIQAAVQGAVERRCGLAPSDKVYMEKRRRGREVSALFLLDLSASTSSMIEEGSHKGETVLQVLLSSVAIMARALGQLEDRYAVFGFSGYGRERVEFLCIKSFDESLGDGVWRRMGGLKPLRSTRIGAAIRHAHHILKTEASFIKLLLLLSDGYPQDHDYGEDRTDREYGLQDTAQALREAEANHVIPFCITVDAAGHDYLRRMCSPRGYLVLNSVHDLPAELPKVYLRLRGY